MRCLIQDIQIHSLNQCRLEGADPIKKILRHDIIPEKVELINQKKSPIQDDYIEKYLVEKDLNLTATLDAEAAYKDADFVVIAAPINYDSKKNFFDTSAVENVIELVIEYNTDAVMVIKSTIPVGYTASIREKYHCDNIIFSPEFLRESKALYDNLYPLRIIVGTDALMGYAGMDYGTFADTRLRDVPYEVFEAYKDHLPELWRRRAEHYYSEFARAEKGAELWRKGDLEGYGQLVFESGKSSIYSYECGCDELKKLYEIMRNTDGIYGGRFSGAGFKGCCMALVDPEKVEDIKAKVTEEYLKAFPELEGRYSAYVCESADGVRL